MDCIEKLFNIIENKKCKTKSCEYEIEKLNTMIYIESEKGHPSGHFSYQQYYLDDDNNLKSQTNFQYRGRY